MPIRHTDILMAFNLHLPNLDKNAIDLRQANMRRQEDLRRMVNCTLVVADRLDHPLNLLALFVDNLAFVRVDTSKLFGLSLDLCTMVGQNRNNDLVAVDLMRPNTVTSYVHPVELSL